MAQRLGKLRQLLNSQRLTAYVLPRTDQHQSEYITERDERVQWVSGFSGSSGLGLISQKEALLWTDSRYFIQAQKELYQGWQLKKMLPGGQKWFEYVLANYPKMSRIGFDPTLITAKSGQERVKTFKEKGLQFVPIRDNLIDSLWEDRPKNQAGKIFLHEAWAGKTMKEKVKWIRQKIREKKGQAAIFNDLSQIAWILNIRSNQIPHNPFFKGVLVITLDGGRLYLPEEHPSLKCSELKAHLDLMKINAKPYPPKFEANSLIVKDSLNYSIYEQVKNQNCIEWQGIGLERAVRTQKQISGFKHCHLADGVVMAKFWAWRASKETVTEYDAAQKIDGLRKLQQYNKGLSFDTISAGGPNAAIIHYRPMPDNSLTITKDMVHLVDSGGQYLNGTTDVTRVFHFGTPTAQEKEAYTRVLMGNLDLERLKWPKNTLTGADIDILARRHLWAKGWDYLHGTGHGVGYFAGVHQGPVSISRLSKTVFKQGMIVTNQPGYYSQGKFGMRIENMLLVRQKDNLNYFQNLTLCPYDLNLIDSRLLDPSTIDYINSYHERVWRKLGQFLKHEHSAFKWLKQATRPLL